MNEFLQSLEMRSEKAWSLTTVRTRDFRYRGWCFYLGRWWWRGGWYPDYDIRLFRRDRATWGGTDPHEKILVNGKVRRLRNPLYHFSYHDIEDHVQRINRFTSISSRELFHEQKRWRLRDALLRPAFRFFRSLHFESRLPGRLCWFLCCTDGGSLCIPQVC